MARTAKRTTPELPQHFLDWKTLKVRAAAGEPVWISESRDGECKWRGCVPEIKNGGVDFGRRTFVPKSSIGSGVAAGLVSRNGVVVSVMNTPVSRVLIRSCSHFAGYDGVDSNLIMVRKAVEESLWVALFVDEPVGPVGDRCLFITEGGVAGSADLTWVMENSGYMSPAIQKERTVEHALNVLINKIMGRRQVFIVDRMPQTSEKLRKIKAPEVWKEWRQAEVKAKEEKMCQSSNWQRTLFAG